MAPKHQQRQLAKEIYLSTDKTQQEIADILDVNRRTIYLWIKEGKWEEMRLAAQQAPGIILQDIYNHITEINNSVRQREPADRCPTMQEVEKLRKLLNMTTVINKKHTGGYMEAFEELVYFIARFDADLAKKVMIEADNYVKGSFGDEKFYLTSDRDECINKVVKNLAKEPVLYEAEQKLREKRKQAEQQPNDLVAALNYCAPCDTNAIICDNDAMIPRPVTDLISDAPNSSGSATELLHEEKVDEYEIPQCPISGFSPNGITPGPLPPSRPPANCSCNSPLRYPDCSCKSSVTIDEILKLPEAQRPSPFRDGKIVWVNHIDDIEKRLDNFGRSWGEHKMSDQVKQYPK